MELRQLRNFIQVIEAGSITAAALRLDIAQPALSRQVRALEEELGTALLRRHGRGVRPTEEGLLLARRARALLAQVEDMANEVSGNGRTLSGIVALGLPPTVADVLATHLVERALRVHPGVNLRIVSGFSGHVRDWLARGRIDLGIAYDDGAVPVANARPVVVERLFLIQSPGGAEGPVTATEALRGPLILPNPEHGLRALLDARARGAGVEPEVVLEIDVLPAILAFVERGLGSTILPLAGVTEAMRAGRLVARPIEGEAIDRRLVLMAPLDRPAARLTTAFSDFLIEEIHALSAAGRWPGTMT